MNRKKSQRSFLGPMGVLVYRQRIRTKFATIPRRTLQSWLNGLDNTSKMLDPAQWAGKTPLRYVDLDR